MVDEHLRRINEKNFIWLPTWTKEIERNMNGLNLMKYGMDLLKLKYLVHVNGNVTIDLRQGVTERLNIM